ncbi:MAG: nitroreductase family protein [Clostridiales bacterium]|jgi:nitroreductase|nr:nitroreductase family protein [Clostridiales bacterium]
MDFFETVFKRYTHKTKFLADSVPLADLELIAKAGLAAPTGNNTQCVKLVILRDKKSVEELCEISPTEGLKTAPAAIAVFTDMAASKGIKNFEMEDYAAAAENMLLAAVALGYVSAWLDSPYFDDDKRLAAEELLNAPEWYKLWVVLPIGLPDGEGTRRSKIPFEELVSYGKIGDM